MPEPMQHQVKFERRAGLTEQEYPYQGPHWRAWVGDLEGNIYVGALGATKTEARDKLIDKLYREVEFVVERWERAHPVD